LQSSLISAPDSPYLFSYYNNLFRLNGKYHRARAGMPVLPSSFERRLAESPISCVSAGRNQVRFLSPQFTSMSWQPVSSVTTTCPSPGLFTSISRNPTERGCARHFDSQQRRLGSIAALYTSIIKKKCSNSLNFLQNYTHETLEELDRILREFEKGEDARAPSLGSHKPELSRRLFSDAPSKIKNIFVLFGEPQLFLSRDCFVAIIPHNDK
jgi:hypothetical protein